MEQMTIKAAYPTAFKPLGIPRPSKNRAIASYKCAPMSESGMRVIVGSVSDFDVKMASASRCREGEDGAVNWKTPGPVRATLSKTVLEKISSKVKYTNLTPCGMMGRSIL
jgi:hypothetical protein